MIVLDTNVISEMTKSAPSPIVAAWLDEQSTDGVFITAITLAEIGFGIAILPDGRRRQALQAALARTVELFEGRILSFDEGAARSYADLAAAARAAGQGFPTPDGYIAAIAAVQGYAVATRDTGPFQAGGIVVINPWDFRPGGQSE